MSGQPAPGRTHGRDIRFCGVGYPCGVLLRGICGVFAGFEPRRDEPRKIPRIRNRAEGRCRRRTKQRVRQRLRTRRADTSPPTARTVPLPVASPHPRPPPPPALCPPPPLASRPSAWLKQTRPRPAPPRPALLPGCRSGAGGKRCGVPDQDHE